MAIPNFRDAAGAAHVFKALAEPTRLRILGLIGDGERTVKDLTALLGCSQPVVSHHMRILVGAGLVTGDKEGVWTYYSIVPAAVDQIIYALRGSR